MVIVDALYQILWRSVRFLQLFGLIGVHNDSTIEQNRMYMVWLYTDLIRPLECANFT